MENSFSTASAKTGHSDPASATWRLQPYAGEALAWTKAVMTKLGLSLNEEKTSLRDARQERFDFLG